jgi:hypothetical protein
MRGYAAAARRQLGILRGGDEGAELVHEADEFFRGQGVLRADRFAAMLAPGFGNGAERPSPRSRGGGDVIGRGAGVSRPAVRVRPGERG